MPSDGVVESRPCRPEGYNAQSANGRQSLAGVSDSLGSGERVSPTVFRVGAYRFFFFSREESRLHVHAESAEGEAKFWLEPEIALARSHGFAEKDLRRIRAVIHERESEIRDAWNSHFGG